MVSGVEYAGGDSVTLWLREVKQGNQEESARKLWNRYAQRLLRLARQTLGRGCFATSDEEDIALSVFTNLCDGALRGRFDNIVNRIDLWGLLITLTRCKVVDQRRREQRVKRHADTALRLNEVSIAGLPDPSPTPEFLAILEEEARELLELLRDDTLRQIAILKMEGYTTREIADRLEISLRTVERKVQLIREVWLHRWQQNLQATDAVC